MLRLWWLNKKKKDDPLYCRWHNIAGLETQFIARETILRALRPGLVRIASTTILWDLHPALLLVGQYYGPRVPLYHKSHNIMELVFRFIVTSSLFYPNVALSNSYVRA